MFIDGHLQCEKTILASYILTTVHYRNGIGACMTIRSLTKCNRDQPRLALQLRSELLAIVANTPKRSLAKARHGGRKCPMMPHGSCLSFMSSCEVVSTWQAAAKARVLAESLASLKSSTGAPEVSRVTGQPGQPRKESQPVKQRKLLAAVAAERMRRKFQA